MWYGGLVLLPCHLPHCPGWPHACRGWSQPLGGSNVSCCLRHCQDKRRKMACASMGRWHQPWDGSCLCVLIPLLCLEFCMFRCTLSSTTTGLLSQSGWHRDRSCSQALSAAPPVPVTNISVNKEVCLFRVIFSSLLPNDHRIKAALLDQNRSLRHSGTQ